MTKASPSLPLMGSVVAAIAAGLCCVGPLVLLLLGIGGSWVATLTAFEPYRPIFIVVVVALLIWAGWQMFRPIEHCTPGSVCAIPQQRNRYQILFVITALIALVLITSQYWLIYVV